MPRPHRCVFVLCNWGSVTGARPRAIGCSRADSTEIVSSRQRRGCTPQPGCQWDTSPAASRHGEQQVVPSVAPSQNYEQTHMHMRVHTLTHVFPLASSPLQPRRARAQLCLAGRRRRLGARSSDAAARTEGPALPAPGAGAGAAGAQSEGSTPGPGCGQPRELCPAPVRCAKPHRCVGPCPAPLRGAASGPHAQRAPCPLRQRSPFWGAALGRT